MEGATGGHGVELDLGGDALGDLEGAGREGGEGCDDVFVVSGADGFLADGFVGVIEVGFEEF